jgi:hypothetical protein
MAFQDTDRTVAVRVDEVDFTRVHADFDAQGWAIAQGLLTHAESGLIAGRYHRPTVSAATW